MAESIVMNDDFSGDSGDEGSFYGFDETNLEERRDVDGSDVEFDGLESEDGENSDGEDEVQQDAADEWTSTLKAVQVPDYLLTPQILFPIPDNHNELDFLSAFLGDDLIDWIVYQTNLYARQKLSTTPARLAKYKDVTREEMRAYFGILIIMGIVRQPTIALYWSNDDYFGNAGIKKVMNKNRFQEISCYLHFNDSTSEPARGANNFDRLYKVRPIINHVKTKFLGNYLPSKNLSVDEGMIAYKGRISFKQYMPKKPTKYGIKVWMLADSSNGYVLNFNTYLGKEAGQRLVHGLGYHVVTRLVEPYMNKKHHVYFDNYFSSVRLVEHLEAQDTFACGTVRPTRKDLPAVARTKLKPGEKVLRQKGNLVFTKWHDKRDVCMLSSNCSPLDADFMVQRRGENVQIAKPVSVKIYNAHMGGVDLNDQLRKYYHVGRASYKWYKYVFWYLIDVSICNSYILFNFDRRSNGKSVCKQLDFRTNVAKQMIAGYSSVVGPNKRRKSDPIPLDPANANVHYITKIRGRKRVCIYCKKQGQKTDKGRAIETTFECFQCGLALCKIDCFREYHQD